MTAGILPPGAYEAADKAWEDFCADIARSSPRDELEAALLAAAPVIIAAERERIARLAEQNNATYRRGHEAGWPAGPFAELIREEAGR